MLGEVFEISYKENDFSKVEVTVITNDNILTYSFITICGNGKVISVKVKEVDLPLTSNSISQYGIVS